MVSIKIKTKDFGEKNTEHYYGSWSLKEKKQGREVLFSKNMSSVF